MKDEFCSGKIWEGSQKGVIFEMHLKWWENFLDAQVKWKGSLMRQGSKWWKHLVQMHKHRQFWEMGLVTKMEPVRKDPEQHAIELRVYHLDPLRGLNYDKPRQHIKKQRHYFANKGPSSQSYGFSSCHVWMWELDHKESWAPKNWCFWTVMLAKTLEGPLGFKEIKPVNPNGNQSWIFIGRTDAKVPVLWPPDVKSWFIRKDPVAGKDWG